LIGERKINGFRYAARLACISLLSGGVGLVAGLIITPEDADDADRNARPDDITSCMHDYAWSDLPEPAFSAPPFASHLKGVAIVLDPGHGGRSVRRNWKRGPTGLREAAVNLRVAQYLRDFLVEVGARVVMTREKDVYLHADDGRDLSARIEIANGLQADLFLSIHHNAAQPGSTANYTTMFYHGALDENPASVDVAWFLLDGVNEALRLEQHLGCGVVSDYALFPGKGFRVLREAMTPAVLSEASFHTNPAEEKRLRDPVYNRREAYGLFTGLARWAQAGLPSARIVQPEGGTVSAGDTLVIQLDDGLSGRGSFGMNLPQLAADSIVVGYEGRAASIEYTASSRQVRMTVTERMISAGGMLYVDFVNLSGQHVLHPRLALPARR